MLELQTASLLIDSLRRLDEGFAALPAQGPRVDIGALRAVLDAVAVRMAENYPYFHPLYAGQMLKPPHPIARLAYYMAMYINPNNHALDGGLASSQMEKEAVRDIAAMFGWKTFIGHLTSGGTMANLEALWIAGRMRPGKKIVASSQAHYTHGRISSVLQLPFECIDVDSRGRMDLEALERRLAVGDVGTVVATIGTTAVGAIDSLAGILPLRDRYEFRLHVDAAYGGYFALVDGLDRESEATFERIRDADSIVVDPHKHGMQPYGCGCVLFNDPSVGTFYKHESPYTYFSSNELHLGEISLECSRAGAAAVALWATQKLLPLERNGVFALELARGRQAALDLFRRLQNDPRHMTALPPELDIVIWAPKARDAEEISRLSRRYFEAAAKAHLHLALVHLPAHLLRPHWPCVQLDHGDVVCLRSCLMKPEHLDWIDRIWDILDRTADAVARA